MLFNAAGNRKPFLPIRHPNMFGWEDAVQLVERTERDGNRIRPALAFGKNLAAATWTKLPDKIIARSEFRHLSRDSHALLQEKRANKKGRPAKPLTIPAMTRPDIDRRPGHNKCNRPAKALAGPRW